MKVHYFVPDTQNPFWKEVVAGVENIADQNRMEVEIIDGRHDGELQARQLKGFESRNPDAVLLSALEPKSVSMICRTIINAGIPVIAVDQNLGANATASVLSGNMKGGILAAEFIGEQLGGKARIVRIRAEAGLENVSLRSSSFEDECKRRGLEIITELTAESSKQKSFTAMHRFLVQRQPFDAVFAENDAMALGAIDALKETRHSPWPVLVGYDGVREALDAIRKSEMAGTVGQNPRKLGEKAAQILARATGGEPYDQVTIVLPELITRQNLASIARRA
jgi:ribose transport system substrate-binding protein